VNTCYLCGLPVLSGWYSRPFAAAAPHVAWAYDIYRGPVWCTESHRQASEAAAVARDVAPMTPSKSQVVTTAQRPFGV
jgi:hypothetical protein